MVKPVATGHLYGDLQHSPRHQFVLSTEMTPPIIVLVHPIINWFPGIPAHEWTDWIPKF